MRASAANGTALPPTSMVPMPTGFGADGFTLGIAGRFVNGGTTGTCGTVVRVSTNGGSLLGGVSGTGSGKRIGGSVRTVGITNGGGGMVPGRTGVGSGFDGTG